MDDGGGEVSERARRRREEGERGGLSVADLLARHGGERRSRQANSHRLAGDDWEDSDGAADDSDADDTGSDRSSDLDRAPRADRAPGPPPADARADPASAPRGGPRAPRGTNGAPRRAPNSPGPGAVDAAPPRGNGVARPRNGSGAPNNRGARPTGPGPELPTLTGPAVPPPAGPTRPVAGGPHETKPPREPLPPNGPSGRSAAPGPRENTRPPGPNGAGPRQNGAVLPGPGRPPAGDGPRRRDDVPSAYRQPGSDRPDQPGRPGPRDNGTRPPTDSATEAGTRTFGAGSGFTSSEFTGVASTAGLSAPPANGRAPSRRPAGRGGREPSSGAPVEATDSVPAAKLTAAPEPPVEVAPEDRTELLFGKDELSDATILLTKLERLGLPAGADTRESTDDREGPGGPSRSGQRDGSWFTPGLSETTPAPADPFTDTTVLPPKTQAPNTSAPQTQAPNTSAPSTSAAPPSDSTPAPSRPGRANDSAETAIIARADVDGPYPVDRDGTIDDSSTSGEHDEAELGGYTGYREHHDYDVDDYQRDDEPVRDRADDVDQDDDELPQLTSFGVRDTSDKLTTPHGTDKTAAADDRDEADVSGKTGDTGTSRDTGTAARDTGESTNATGTDKPSTPSTPGDRDSAARDAIALRTAKIDETLSRLTAIHAGLGDELAERVSRTDRTRSAKKSTRSDQDEDSGAPEGRGRGRSGGSKTGGPKADSPKGLGRFLRSRRSRGTAIVLVALLLLTPAVGFGCSWWLNGKLRTVDALDATGAGVIDAASQAGDQNYLVVAAGDDDLPQTVVLAHLPAKSDRAVLLSAPTNLIVDRPGCERYDSANRRYSGDTVPAQSADPLADAFEEGGPRCLVSTLQRMTGIPINHFIQLDPAGITPMVDAVNGVPMCVSDRVDDAVLGAVVPTPGQQMMNGEQAKAYATAREVRGEPTDGSGLRLRQQRVLSALLTKASALSPFLHLPTVASLASALGAHSYVAGTDLGELAALGDALAAIDQTKVDYVPIPTADEADTQGNAVVRPADASKLFAAMRANRPLDGEGESASSTDGESSGLPPSAVTLSVFNGSSHAGVAGKAADSLRGVGFTVTSVRDSRHQDGGASVIRASADQAAGSTTLARAVPGATVQTVPGTGVLELVLGDSFNGQVQAAPGSTTAGPSLVTAAALACH